MKQLLTLICTFFVLQTSAQENTKPKQWLGILTLAEKYKDEKNWTKEDGRSHFRI